VVVPFSRENYILKHIYRLDNLDKQITIRVCALLHKFGVNYLISRQQEKNDFSAIKSLCRSNDKICLAEVEDGSLDNYVVIPMNDFLNPISTP
jgi:hypothetical protein